jgi:hypothetical protein
MTAPELKALWRHALDTADAAIDAGRRAGTLTPGFCAAELRHIRAEREWLATVRLPGKAA